MLIKFIVCMMVDCYIARSTQHGPRMVQNYVMNSCSVICEGGVPQIHMASLGIYRRFQLGGRWLTGGKPFPNSSLGSFKMNQQADPEPIFVGGFTRVCG